MNTSNYTSTLFHHPTQFMLHCERVSTEDAMTQQRSSIFFFCCCLFLFTLSSADNGEELTRSDFPTDFLWGTATSAYQVEGGYLEDGKSLNNWDIFSRVPGGIQNGDTGDIADDHYHRFMEDIELLQSLGVNSYRLSISWSRILPRGRHGGVNIKGIMFYNKIISTLLLKGIEPFVTIHHHDYPAQFDSQFGGWLSPLMQEELLELARTCFEEFGDRVKYWTPINEINIFAQNAYLKGLYPPARCSRPFGNCSAGNSTVEPFIAAHNMLLAHAKVASLYRKQFQPKQGGLIGTVASAQMYEPYQDNEFDCQAVTRALAFNALWVLDPLVHGRYPLEMREHLGKTLPEFSDEESNLLEGSVGFLGINHYTTLYAIDCLHSPCPAPSSSPTSGFVHLTGIRNSVPIGEPTGMSSFFAVPRGMEKLVSIISRRYPKIPIFVTENGYSDQIGETDPLLDYPRVKYLKGYLAALARAIRKGANVKGYLVWSLMDNLEWASGYNVKFGVYYVNRTNLDRLPKSSAVWYSSFLANETTLHTSTSASGSQTVK